jgi:ATP/ADP translocase
MNTTSEPSLIQTVFEELKKPARIAIFLLSILFFSFPTILGTMGLFMSEWTGLGIEILGWICLIYSFKEICWRVKKAEHRFIVPIIIHSALIIFIYTLSRIVKDPMSSTSMGNEVTIILKCTVVIISSTYQYFYNKFSKHMKLSSLVFVAVVPIIAYLSFFCFFLYENPNVTMSIATQNRLIALYPFLKRLIPIVANWHISLYYIFSETFSVTALQVFMWQVNNSQIKKENAKRIIPAIILSMQIPTMLAARTGMALSDMAVVSDGVRISAICMMAATALLIINNFVAFRVKMNIDGQMETLCEDQQAKSNKKASGAPAGVWNHIRKNYVFLLVALLTVFYGLSSSWMEQFWKKNLTLYSQYTAQETIKKAKNIVNYNNAKGADEIVKFLRLDKIAKITSQVKKFDPFHAITHYFGFSATTTASQSSELLKNLSSRIYQNMFSAYMMRQARYAMVFLIFGTSFLMQYLSWTAFASLTPIFGIIGTLTIIGIPLLSKISFFSPYITRLFGDSKLLFITVAKIGSYMVACFKTLKYASFDTSKEQFITRYSQEERNEIKYLEGYFGRFGKSGGSLLMAAIFGINQNVEFTSTPVMVLLFVLLFFMVMPLWLLSVVKIGNVVQQQNLKEEQK